MILRALVTRPLVRAPARFVATALGVAAGVAAVVATLAASRAALASVRTGANELAGGAQLEIVRPGGVSLAQLERLLPLAPIARATPVVEEIVLAPRIRDAVRLLGIDAFSATLARELTAGPDGDASGGDDGFLAFAHGEGAWISAALAQDLDAAPGGAIELDVHAKLVSLPVAGTFAGGERPTSLARTIVVDVALAQELLGRGNRVDRIALVPRGDSSAAEIAERVQPLLEPGAEIVSPSERASETAALAKSLEFNLTALSGISLLVGAVLVATTLATSVVQRARTIALLRSLGASAGQISRAIVFEALALGLFGGALGVALGFLLARALHASMRQTVAAVVTGAGESPIELEARDVVLGIALGVATSFAAAVLPLLEGARTPPIQALRGESRHFSSFQARGFALLAALGLLALAYELVQLPAWRGLPVAGLAGSLAILVASFFAFAPAIDGVARLAARVRSLPAPLALACAALAAGRRRCAWAAAAVGTAVALSLSIATMVGSFRDSIVDWSAAVLQADLAIRPVTATTGVPIGKLDPAVLEATLAALPGAQIDSDYATDVHFRGERISLGAVDLDVLAPRGGFVFVGGDDARAVLERARRTRGVLVNEAFALRFGVEPGARIELAAAGATLARQVAGVFRDYGDSRGVVLVDRGTYLTFFPSDAPRVIAVYLPDARDRAGARAALASALAPRFQVEVLENRELRQSILDVFERTFAITSALQAVAAVVAVIAVLSVLFALVSERRADLALASAIGASRVQIAVQVATQAGLLGLLGALVGAATGLVIGVVLVVVVQTQSFGWTLAFSMPWDAIAGTIAAVGLACLVAGLLPARAVLRAPLVESLRTE